MARHWLARVVAATTVLGCGSLVSIAGVASLPPTIPTAGRVRAWLADATYLDTVGVVFQQGSEDCGVAVLAMVLRGRGRDTGALDELRARVLQREQGLTLLEMRQAARAAGLVTQGVRTNRAGLRQLPLPAVVHFPDHFALVDYVHADGGVDLRDPDIGRVRMSARAFEKHWTGVAMVTRGIARTVRAHPARRDRAPAWLTGGGRASPLLPSLPPPGSTR